MFHSFKCIVYRVLDKTKRISKGSVVMSYQEWHMVRDYITLLEGECHRASGRTFKDIPNELKDCFGKEKFQQFYEQGGN